MRPFRGASLRWTLAGVTASILAVAGPVSPASAASTPALTPTPIQLRATQPPSASDILGRLAASRKGITSYSVPIHFDLTVHKGTSVNAKLDATRYFQNPDRDVLVMKSMPSIAKQFSTIYTGTGTPETWPSQYDVTMADAPDAQTYRLRGVPTNDPGISYVLLDVARDSAAPVRAQLFYKNGGTVTLAFENQTIAGGYIMPQTETIDIAFPDYKVHAVGHYGSYSINQPIPDSVWQTKPQPLPT